MHKRPDAHGYGGCTLARAAYPRVSAEVRLTNLCDGRACPPPVETNLKFVHVSTTANIYPSE